MLDGLTLDQMRVFVAVAGSFRGAAALDPQFPLPVIGQAMHMLCDNLPGSWTDSIEPIEPTSQQPFGSCSRRVASSSTGRR